jgi:hypothetical protein
VSVIVGVTFDSSIGATPSARLGAWFVVGDAAFCLVTVVAGTDFLRFQSDLTERRLILSDVLLQNI